MAALVIMIQPHWRTGARNNTLMVTTARGSMAHATQAGAAVLWAIVLRSTMLTPTARPMRTPKLRLNAVIVRHPVGRRRR